MHAFELMLPSRCHRRNRNLLGTIAYNNGAMKFNFFAICAFLIGLPFISKGQDPTKVAPDVYKLQLANAWVKILRVSYAPNSKVPVHDHSKGPAAYVYLVDSGPVRFLHEDWEHPVLTRPPTKAGSFRLSPTRFDNETHSVENNSNTRSDFLRIEILTEHPDRQSLNGRFAPFSGDRSNGLNKKEFENSQLRTVRLISKPGTPLTVSAGPDDPTLIVVLGGLGVGETICLAPNESKTLAGTSGTQIELLRFDFKTRPKNR